MEGNGQAPASSHQQTSKNRDPDCQTALISENARATCSSISGLLRAVSNDPFSSPHTFTSPPPSPTLTLANTSHRPCWVANCVQDGGSATRMPCIAQRGGGLVRISFGGSSGTIFDCCYSFFIDGFRLVREIEEESRCACGGRLDPAL